MFFFMNKVHKDNKKNSQFIKTTHFFMNKVHKDEKTQFFLVGSKYINFVYFDLNRRIKYTELFFLFMNIVLLYEGSSDNKKTIF
jgi:hypothetical protein